MSDGNLDDVIEDDLKKRKQEKAQSESKTKKKIKNEAKKKAKKAAKKARKKAAATLFKGVGATVFSSFFSVFIIIFMMIGVVSFITSMPGMVQENILNKIISINDNINELVYGEDYYLLKLATDPDRKPQKEVLKYLDDMGLDPAGFGFAAFYERYTDENGNDVVEYQPTMNNEVLMDGSSIFAASEYNNQLSEQIREEDLIFKYIVSNERAYLVHDLDKLGNLTEKIRNSVVASLFKGMIVAKVEGFDTTNLSVDRENKLLKVTTTNFSEWAKQTMTYNLEGYTGRYGMPLEFLLSLHIATMSPDLIDEMLTNENLITEVRLSLEEAKNDVDYEITMSDGTPFPLKRGKWKDYYKLSEFLSEHMQTIDGKYYIQISDEELEEAKSLFTINGLEGWINHVTDMNLPASSDAETIDKLAYGARDAILGDDAFRVLYVLCMDRFSSDDYYFWLNNAYYGLVSTELDDEEKSHSFLYSTQIMDELVGNASDSYLVSDGRIIEFGTEAEDGFIIVNAKSEAPIIPEGTYNSVSIPDGKYDGVLGTDGGCAMGIIHGLSYYIGDEEGNNTGHIDDVRKEYVQYGITSMLSQIDAFLYRNNWGDVSGNEFVLYGITDDIGVPLHRMNSGGDTYLWLTDDWIKFCENMDEHSDEEIKNKLIEIKTNIKSAYDSISNQTENVQNIIDSLFDRLEFGDYKVTREDIDQLYKIMEDKSEEVETAYPRIKYVIKHWFKDVIFEADDFSVYKNSGAVQRVPVDMGEDSDITVEAIMETKSGSSLPIQTDQPYVVKGDVVTLDGEIVDDSGIENLTFDVGTNEDGTTKKYTVGDGYRTTKKLFTQGQYYTFDGTQETAKSIWYAKQLEKLDGKQYKFAKVIVRSGRIIVATVYKDEQSALEEFGNAYNSSAGTWNANAQIIDKGAEVLELGDTIIEADDNSWSAFLARATNIEYEAEDEDGVMQKYTKQAKIYYIKANQDLSYKSVGTYDFAESKASVHRINTLLDAIDVTTQRNPISFDNTTATGDVTALTAFTILEGMHSEDAELIYRDLKEFLIDLGYYTKAEFEYINTKVLHWFIPDYLPEKEEERVRWRQNKEDDSLEYGAIIYPTSVGENEEESHSGFSPDLDVIAPGTAKITRINAVTVTEDDQSGNNGSSIELQFDGVVEPEIGILDRYTMIIRGIEINTSATVAVVDIDGNEGEMTLAEALEKNEKYRVKVGEVIGKTGTQRIQVILKNKNGAYIDNVEDYMGPELATATENTGEGFSITGTVLTQEEFTDSCTSYLASKGVSNPDFTEENIKKFYSICKQKGVNPEYAFTTALLESGDLAQGEATSTHNYWGLNTPNGSSVPSLGTMLETLALYCDTVAAYQDPLGSSYATIMERYEERKACTDNGGCDPNGYGLPNTIQGVQSLYSSLGSHEYGGPGTGGFYYMDPARAGVTKIYKTHEEFVEKCEKVHEPGSVTTVWEQAQYTAWQVEKKLDKAKEVFGDKAGRFLSY